MTKNAICRSALWLVAAGSLLVFACSEDDGFTPPPMGDGVVITKPGTTLDGSADGDTGSDVTIINGSDASAIGGDGDGWIWTFGGDGNDYPTNVVVDDAGYAYVGVTFRSTQLHIGDITLDRVAQGAYGDDACVIRIAPNGVIDWVVHLDRATIGQQGLALTRDNHLVVGGGYWRDSTFPGSSLDRTGAFGDDDHPYILELDEYGEPQWVRRIDGQFSGVIKALALDANDDVVVSGNFAGQLANFGAGFVLNHQGFADGFVAKYRRGGTIAWQFSFAGSGHDYADNLALAADGTVYVHSWFRSDSLRIGGDLHGGGDQDRSDLLLFSLSSNGRYRWSRVVRTNDGGFRPGQVVVDDAGGAIYVCGEVTEPTWDVDGVSLEGAGRGMYLFEMDANGAFHTRDRYGSTTAECGALHLDSGGRLIAAGAYGGSLDVGLGEASSPSFTPFLAVMRGAAESPGIVSLGPADYANVIGLDTDGLGHAFVTGPMKGPFSSFGGIEPGAIPHWSDLDVFVAKLPTVE